MIPARLSVSPQRVQRKRCPAPSSTMEEVAVESGMSELPARTAHWYSVNRTGSSRREARRWYERVDVVLNEHGADREIESTGEEETTKAVHPYPPRKRPSDGGLFSRKISAGSFGRTPDRLTWPNPHTGGACRHPRVVCRRMRFSDCRPKMNGGVFFYIDLFEE